MLEAQVDDISTVDEKYQGLYSEKDGKHVLDDGLLDLVTTKTKFEDILGKERKTTRSLQAQIESWKELGDKPDEIREKITKLESAVTGDDEAKQKELDRLKAELTDAKDKEVAALNDKISRSDKAVQRYLVDGAAKAAIAELGGNVEVLLPHVTSSLKVMEVGDSLEVRIRDPKDPDADFRYNSKGDPMSVAEFVQALRENEAFKANFRAEERSGGGSQPGSGGGGGGKAQVLTKAQWLDKTARAKPEERQQMIKDRAAGKYRITD